MKPEQKAKRHEHYLKRRATLTPEQLDAERAHQREYARERRATMTPKEVDIYNMRQRERYRKRRANVSPEELDAEKIYQREHKRKRRAIMTPELDAPQLSFLENRFDLSPQQARLVVHLISGASLRSCGKTLCIEYETARRHVKGAFLKTGTHRQSELIVTIIRAMNEMRG